MKKLNIFLIMAGLFIVVSCEKDMDNKVVLQEPDSFVLDTPDYASSTLTLQDVDSIAFSYDETYFGYASTDPVYYVQVSLNEDMTNSLELSSSYDTTYINVATTEFNDTIVSLLGISSSSDLPSDPISVYVRMRSAINNTSVDVSDPVYSNLVTLTSVVPYYNDGNYPEIYLPGSYQSWTPGDENGILYSYKSDNTYENIIYIYEDGTTEETFKVTPEADWDESYGGTLTEDADGNYSGTLDASGDNFNVAPGCYEVTVDMDALTIELVPTDHWTMIGSAVEGDTSWSTDADLFYNGTTQQWETTDYFYAGEFKFRANAAWDTNYGGSDGTLVSGGDNLTIDADGNYTITMDPENLTYTITSEDE